ncbi:hypothetical protein DC522_19190 [Microvirga sp. KLBC 81]|uniref:hypothetical protein n=1 Tax=Microvirga sp. KLBC 81 TaxID=1862707 RepID=UPI000D51600A|nr:hypothetical protein [Microvirga sp. KLBC 81]PVE22772.1 hypothetical protein DC522_19190 [Microvirga sp. KLBC 81]
MNELDRFLERLELLPLGYSAGHYHRRRYGTTLQVSEDGRRVQLYARELGGRDFISFNLFRLHSGETRLKPCEMADQKVVAFVNGYIPESTVLPG